MALGSRIDIDRGYDPSNFSEITRIAITYYQTFLDTKIMGEIRDLIAEGVRKAITEDTVLRMKVKQAIESAAIAMPLDAITEAVKRAVEDLKKEEPK